MFLISCLSVPCSNDKSTESPLIFILVGSLTYLNRNPALYRLQSIPAVIALSAICGFDVTNYVVSVEKVWFGFDPLVELPNVVVGYIVVFFVVEASAYLFVYIVYVPFTNFDYVENSFFESKCVGF